MIRLVAQQEMGDTPPVEGPVRLELRAVFDVPKSWSKKKQAEAFAGVIRPGVRDLDNILKAWLDGMNGVVYRDDRQVSEIKAEKLYGPQALVAVTVSWGEG